MDQANMHVRIARTGNSYIVLLEGGPTGTRAQGVGFSKEWAQDRATFVAKTWNCHVDN